MVLPVCHMRWRFRRGFIGIEEPAEAVGDGLAGMEIVIVGFEGPVGLGAIVKFHGR